MYFITITCLIPENTQKEFESILFVLDVSFFPVFLPPCSFLYLLPYL